MSRETTNFRPIEEIIPSPKVDVQTAGRIVLYRSFGKIAFAHLQDDSGRIQIMFSRENCKIVVGDTVTEQIGSDESAMTAFKFSEKLLDLGDFVGIRGELFLTHKGELTVFVSEFQFLGKALRPLPEKFHGLADSEIKYRERHLDLITDASTMNRFRFRSDFIRTLREFYWKE